MFSVRRILILLLFLLIFIPSQSVFAQPSSYQTPNNAPEVPKNLNTWTQNVLIEVLSSMICQMTGQNPTSPDRQCLGYDETKGQIGFVSNGGGMIGLTSSMIGVLYTPPVHLNDYTSYLSQNFGFPKPIYAQSGINSLTPLTNIWVVMRNIVYLFFVGVFVTMGMAIMLRVRIDPRTVMSVQNQIPKLIIGIILVTFSFAIAGFLIDLMWIIIYLVISILAPSANISAGSVTQQLNTPAPGFGNYVTSGTNPNLGGLFNLASSGGASIGQIVSNLFTNPENANGSFTDVLSNPVDFVMGVVIRGILGIVFGVLAFFIIAIALLWALIKLWFALLKAYVFILVDIIFAPFWILGGIIPGVASEKVGFSAWLRDIVSNLAVFPVTVGMFLLARFLLVSFSEAPRSGSNFVPPLVGNPGDPNTLGALLALGVVLATPKVLETTKGVFKAAGIGAGGASEAVQVGRKVAGNIGGTFFNRITRPEDLSKAQTQGWLRRVVKGPTASSGEPTSRGWVRRKLNKLEGYDPELLDRHFDQEIAGKRAAEQRAAEQAKRNKEGSGTGGGPEKS